MWNMCKHDCSYWNLEKHLGFSHEAGNSFTANVKDVKTEFLVKVTLRITSIHAQGFMLLFGASCFNVKHVQTCLQLL